MKTLRKRSATVREILNTRFRSVEFDGIWHQLFGNPELSGAWLVWGESANGKTSFNLQLSKYLTKFGRVAYNTIEEGISESFKTALVRNEMQHLGSRFQVLDRETIEQLETRLKRKASPDIIILDSVQYTELNKLTAKALVDSYPRKLFVFVSHACGKLPDGRTANAIRYHANVKIRIEGYTAKVESRYGGDKTASYVIWQDGATAYWGEKY